MSPTSHEAGPAPQQPPWARLYRVGAVAAVAYVVLLLVPVVLVFTAPVPPAEATALLTYVAEHRVVYLTELVCFVGLAVPGLIAFAALAMALRSVEPGLAALGGLLGVSSETIALALGSSPPSLHPGVVLLSQEYAATTDPARRAALEAAAEALIATTNAVSWAGILTAAAILVLSIVGRHAAMGPRLGRLGIVTGVLGIASEAFRPVIGPGYLVYGLLLPLWFALAGHSLVRAATHPSAYDTAASLGCPFDRTRPRGRVSA